jgi:hypothetical protein
MTTQACTQDWKEMYEKAARQAADWRQNFDVLQRALVGDTGASGIEVAHKLRKDAERYRWLRKNAITLDDFAYYIDDEVESFVDEQMAAAPRVGAA